MKKLMLGILAGLLLFVYQPVWSQAVSNGINSTGTTTTQISFYAGPETSTDADKVNEDIAKGTGAYQSIGEKPAVITGSLQRVLATGRLPQTSENVKLYQQILGVMLLLVAILGWGLYRINCEDKNTVS